MNGWIVAALVGAGVFGPVFVGGRNQPPPKAFKDDTVLPGKIVRDRKTLNGGWHFGYWQKDAQLESGYQGDLHSSLYIRFNEDGTYSLQYSAIWDLQRTGGFIPLPAPLPQNARYDGVSVEESGRYSLSGEVLLLEPEETYHSEVEDGQMVKVREKIASKNRGLLLRIDGKRVHIAGRCADWQMEPICREVPAVWFQLTAQLGRRWVGMQPR